MKDSDIPILEMDTYMKNDLSKIVKANKDPSDVLSAIWDRCTHEERKSFIKYLHRNYENYFYGYFGEKPTPSPSFKFVNHKIYIKGSIVNDFIKVCSNVFMQYSLENNYEQSISGCIPTAYFRFLYFSYYPFKLVISPMLLEETK